MFFRDAGDPAQTALLCGSLPQAVLDGQSEVRAVSLRCGVSVLLHPYVSPPFSLVNVRSLVLVVFSRAAALDT